MTYCNYFTYKWLNLNGPVLYKLTGQVIFVTLILCCGEAMTNQYLIFLFLFSAPVPVAGAADGWEHVAAPVPTVAAPVPTEAAAATGWDQI